MEQTYQHQIPVSTKFTGKTLRVLGNEFKAIGYNGGIVQSRTGDFIFISDNGKRISVQPPINSSSHGVVRYQDSSLVAELQKIIRKVGGRV